MAKKQIKKEQAVPELTIRMLGDSKSEKMTAPAYLTASPSPVLLAQIIHTLRRRTRIRRAHTKDRSEVRGGGRKPWKQKGTGRSRHGSIRSPIWRGGGIAFGPRSRHERIVPTPSGMAKKALAVALSNHLRQGTVEIVRLSSPLPTKTKEVQQQLTTTLKRKRFDRHGLLLLLAHEHAALQRPLRNLAGVTVQPVQQVTVADIVAAKQVWVDEAALGLLEKRCRIS